MPDRETAVAFTADELGNIASALESYIEDLKPYEDNAEVIESAANALFQRSWQQRTDGSARPPSAAQTHSRRSRSFS